MLRNILFILLVSFTVFLQAAVFGFLTVFGVTPNLLLILSLVLFFRPDHGRALMAAVFGGLLYDLLNLNPVIGLWGMAAVILFAVTHWFSANLLANVFLRAAAVFILSAGLTLVTAWPAAGWPVPAELAAGSLLNLAGYLILAAPLNYIFDRLLKESYLQLDFQDRL